jgi:O-succinylhomoserine sulfhydrylase
MAEYVYSRFSNPNIKTLNKRVATLESAEMALSTASGMSALLSVVMGVCKAGDSILCGGNVFGATVQLLSNTVRKFGVRVDYVFGGIDDWRQAMRPETTLLIVETPSNPMIEITDLAALADIAHQNDALLAVDNCFCPWGQRPLAWGCDLVIHSATKYLDGQGRVLGGAIAGSEKLLGERIYPFLRSGGPAISPFSAWTISRGMETLGLRMRAHCESALTLASWLETQPQVTRVLYTGLPSHPAQTLALQQQNGLGGGVITLQIKGGRDETWRFINALSCFSITANFGDVKSTVTHPASTTHSRAPEYARLRMGLTENWVRLSIGLEYVEDLREGLAQGLAAI